MEFTREQIESVKVGSYLIRGREKVKVTEIFARQEDTKGKLFVVGYAEHGPNATMSFSLKEGENSELCFYNTRFPEPEIGL